jgi:glycosyltransferase involved in cell wall biosynthesis
MKIGIDIRSLMDANYSGVPNFTWKLVDELLRLDQINEYKLYYNSWQDVSKKIPAFNFANAGIVATHYPNKIFNYCLQKNCHYPQIDRLLGVDLVWLPHTNFIALSDSCRKIITIHDLSFIRYPQFFSWRKNIWHQLLNLNKILSQFDTIVAVSDNTKRDLEELLNIPPEKIKVIYPGGEGITQVSLSEVKAVQTKYNLPDNYFLYVGNLEPRKNVASIILAFDEFITEHPEYSNYDLVIAGGKGWKCRDIFSAYENANHKEKIHLLGYISDTEKKALYASAKILIYPSFYEGFGFPVLEAMTAGVPVITSANSSLPEVARDAALLINPFNITEIKTAMREILKNTNLTDRLKAKGKLVSAEFTWEKTAREYQQLFST